MIELIIFLVIFLAGVYCGHIISPWIDDKLAPKGDD